MNMTPQQPDPAAGAEQPGSSALTLYFNEFGDNDNADGPVIILHGLFGSARNWQTVGQRLAERRRVLTVDLRNHGDSPHSDVHDYPAMAGDVLALLRRLDLGHATLVGHSMGGKAAMWLALNEPQAVSRLVVVDIAPVSYPDHFGPLIDALLQLPVGTFGSRSEADRQLSAAIPDTGLRQFLLQNLVRNPGGGFRWRANLAALRANRQHVIGFPVPRPGAHFAGPTLFIRGACSGAVTDAYLPTIQRFFPASTLSTIDGTGHWPHAERPQAFYQMLAAFVLKSGRNGAP